MTVDLNFEQFWVPIQDGPIFCSLPILVMSFNSEKDYDKLVKYVLDGESHRLMEKTSDDEEMQEFIKNIPAFQGFCNFTDSNLREA